MNSSPSKQLFTCAIQGTIVGRTEPGHTGSGRAFVKFRLIHRTGFYRSGKWVATAPMEFEVTCWDEQQMLLARTLKPGTDVIVTVKRFSPYLDQGEEPVINITPADILPVAASTTIPSARGQRSGDLVVSPHGEKIAADAWPDTVTDPQLAHHR